MEISTGGAPMGYIHVQTFNNALVSPTSVVGMEGQQHHMEGEAGLR